MEAYVATPDGGGPYPAVIVWQEAFGVNSYVRSVADRLADEGYVALAPEMFHRAGKHIEVAYEDMSKVMPLLGVVENKQLATDARAAAHTLRARNDVDPARMGAIGFCVGGLASLLTGLSVELAAVVAYYPGGVVRGRPPMKLQPIVDQLVNMKAATQLQLGGDDTSITHADIDAMRAALVKSGCTLDVVVHPGAKHGFHSDDRAAVFHPKAAEAAWHQTLAFLGRTLGGKPSAV
jgi:carboxymethylenebutenolidase